MKVQVNANELSGTHVEKVSVVENAANRRPFKLLKADLGTPDGNTKTLLDRVSKMFQPKEDLPADAKITAVFVQKHDAKRMFPLLKEAGFRIDREHAELIGDVLLLKQEGFDAGVEGSMVAVSDTTAFGFNTVVKDFHYWNSNTDFDTTLATQSFYPSVRLACDALHETLWAIMDGTNSHADVVQKIEAATKAFAAHVTGLARVLPVEVIKLEQKLAQEFEGHTVASNTEPKSAESTEIMKNDPSREAMRGDLAGLYDEPAVIAKAEAAPADEGKTEVVDDEAKTEVVEKTDGAEAGVEGEKVEGTETTEAAAATVEKTEDEKHAALVQTITDAVVASLTPVLKGFKEAIEKVDASNAANATALTAIEKTAKTALEKAENTVVVADVADDHIESGSLRTRGTAVDVKKSNAPATEADIWAGVLPELGNHRG